MWKLIFTRGKGGIITNKIIKQWSSKTYINKIYPLSTLGFGYSPHKATCDILSKHLVSSKFKDCFSKKYGIVLDYVNKVKYIQGIVLPTTSGY